MALAYGIVAYKNPAQIGRLLRSIAHSDNLFFVHYDKRSPRSEHEALARWVQEFPNLHILPARPVLWGRYSIVDTQLEMMRRCLQSERPWSHFITLSGQCLPLKPQDEMVRECEAQPTTSYVNFFDPLREPIWKDVHDRVTRIYLDSMTLESFLQIPFLGRRVRGLLGWTNSIPFVPWVRRKKPDWFRYMGGSNHFVLSREAVAYAVNDPQAQKITQWLKFTNIPEESIFQSVLLNSPLADRVINDDRRAVFWQNSNSPSPLTLKHSDLPALHEAREKGRLFARKFDINVDNQVICELEKELGL